MNRCAYRTAPQHIVRRGYREPEFLTITFRFKKATHALYYFDFVTRRPMTVCGRRVWMEDIRPAGEATCAACRGVLDLPSAHICHRNQ